MPDRIQRKRTKGWRMPEGAVYVGRPSRWGNPFPIAEHGAKLSLALYRNVLNGLWSPIILQDLSDHLRHVTNNPTHPQTSGGTPE